MWNEGYSVAATDALEVASPGEAFRQNGPKGRVFHPSSVLDRDDLQIFANNVGDFLEVPWPASQSQLGLPVLPPGLGMPSFARLRQSTNKFYDAAVCYTSCRGLSPCRYTRISTAVSLLASSSRLAGRQAGKVVRSIANEFTLV